jgi:hypothetical protein
MLGSLALRLKFSIFKAEPTCAGVPLSISSPILLDAIGAALWPKMLGCLGRRLNLPIDIIEVFLLPTLVRPLSCARIDSTLLDRARVAPSPSMLGWRARLLKFPIASKELSIAGVRISFRPTSAGLLDPRSNPSPSDSSPRASKATRPVSSTLCALLGPLPSELRVLIPIARPSDLEAAPTIVLPLVFLTCRTLLTT